MLRGRFRLRAQTGSAIRAKAAGVAAMEATRRRLEQRIDQALGDARADLVIRNARTLNLVTGDLDDGDIAICDETIVGTCDNYPRETEIDARGQINLPR